MLIFSNQFWIKGEKPESPFRPEPFYLSPPLFESSVRSVCTAIVGVWGRGVSGVTGSYSITMFAQSCWHFLPVQKHHTSYTNWWITSNPLMFQQCRRLDRHLTYNTIWTYVISIMVCEVKENSRLSLKLLLVLFKSDGTAEVVSDPDHNRRMSHLCVHFYLKCHFNFCQCLSFRCSFASVSSASAGVSETSCWTFSI